MENVYAMNDLKYVFATKISIWGMKPLGPLLLTWLNFNPNMDK